MTETGLVVDGVHGIYVGREVVAMARGLGWEGPEWDADDEWCHEVESDARDWLNEHHADEGHSFDWHEGSFFYLSDDEWEEMV